MNFAYASACRTAVAAGLPPDNKNNKRMQIEKHKYANIHRYILTRSFVDILCLHNE